MFASVCKIDVLNPRQRRLCLSYLYDRIMSSVVPQQEHIYCDPKDGELYLCRVKSEEILLEARNDTDVQIVR